MAKFGELLDSKVPVLIYFFGEWDLLSQTENPVLLNLCTEMGDNMKCIKIDVDKNPDLCEALRVKALPTVMLYKEGELVFRSAGEIEKLKISNQIL